MISSTPAFVIFSTILSFATNILIFPIQNRDSPIILSVFHIMIIGVALAINWTVISLCRASVETDVSAVLTGYLVTSIWIFTLYRFAYNTLLRKGH